LAALATGDPDALQSIVGGSQQINQLSAEIERGPLRTLPARLDRLGSVAGHRAAACQ
jgi:hypothetical protein